jgi:prolyl-tRNA synthetase
VPVARTAKAVFYMATDTHDEAVAPEPVFVVVRGDLQVNEVKLRNLLGGKELRPMTDAEAASYGIVPGYASAIGIDGRVRVIADVSVPDSPNLVAGANEAGKHYRNVNYGRDWSAREVEDVALAEAGHQCARCGGTLGTARGIEMGHVFRLGQIYTKTFDTQVLDEAGEQRLPTMGCYGIGVDRIIGAAVEAHHDERGIAWPASIAPFDVHLVGLGLGRDEALRADADALYEELRAAGLDVLYDDRDESPGVKFNDADLLGIPLRVTASSRNHKAGVVEVQRREGGEAELTPRSEVVAQLVGMRGG